MRKWAVLTTGAVAILIGTVWTLQGLGYLSGGAMANERIWAVIGPVVAVAGLAAVVYGLRSRHR